MNGCLHMMETASLESLVARISFVFLIPKGWNSRAVGRARASWWMLNESRHVTRSTCRFSSAFNVPFLFRQCGPWSRTQPSNPAPPSLRRSLFLPSPQRRRKSQRLPLLPLLRRLWRKPPRRPWRRLWATSCVKARQASSTRTSAARWVHASSTPWLVWYRVCSWRQLISSSIKKNDWWPQFCVGVGGGVGRSTRSDLVRRISPPVLPLQASKII